MLLHLDTFSANETRNYVFQPLAKGRKEAVFLLGHLCVDMRLCGNGLPFVRCIPNSFQSRIDQLHSLLVVTMPLSELQFTDFREP